VKKMKGNAVPWWGWFAWVIAIALGIVAYNHLPTQVATHFNLAGKPDHMGSRLEAVLMEPTIMLGIILLWHVLWRIDPKKRNYESFWSTYRYIGGVIVVFIGVMYLSTLGHVLNIAPIRFSMRFGPTTLGIMILLLANVLPRLQPNWWVGIRTPWTLSSTESWNRTHRLAGHLGIPTGVLMVILVWVLPNSLIPLAILVPIILWVLITVVASYVYAKT
jgi:uncharacterized membrane protein